MTTGDLNGRTPVARVSTRRALANGQKGTGGTLWYLDAIGQLTPITAPKGFVVSVGAYDVFLQADGGDVHLESAGGDIKLAMTSGGDIKLTTLGGSIVLNCGTGSLVFTGLPTSSVGLGAGAVWNNGGVLNIV